jgi:hypothetical protein
MIQNKLPSSCAYSASQLAPNAGGTGGSACLVAQADSLRGPVGNLPHKRSRVRIST